MRYIKTLMAILLLAALVATGSAVNGVGGANNDGKANPASVIHPNIFDNNNAQANANPNGKSPSGGAAMHGIGNVPGQNANSEPGVANLANVHGGISSVNKNVP